MHNKSVSVKEIRRLSVAHDADSLERCLDSQLSRGENICLPGTDAGEIVSLLVKAAFVRSVVDEERVSVNAAVRVLGARMRGYSGVKQGVMPNGTS